MNKVQKQILGAFIYKSVQVFNISMCKGSVSLKEFLILFLSSTQMFVNKIGRQCVRIEMIELLNCIDERSSVLW